MMCDTRHMATMRSISDLRCHIHPSDIIYAISIRPGTRGSSFPLWRHFSSLMSRALCWLFVRGERCQVWHYTDITTITSLTAQSCLGQRQLILTERGWLSVTGLGGRPVDVIRLAHATLMVIEVCFHSPLNPISGSLLTSDSGLLSLSVSPGLCALDYIEPITHLSISHPWPRPRSRQKHLRLWLRRSLCGLQYVNVRRWELEPSHKPLKTPTGNRK